MLPNGGRHEKCFCRGRQAKQSQQQYSGCRPPLPEDKLAKILIRSNENAGGFSTPAKHNFVGNTGRQFGDIFDLNSIPSKTVHDLTIDALVGEQNHLGVASTG